MKGWGRWSAGRGALVALLSIVTTQLGCSERPSLRIAQWVVHVSPDDAGTTVHLPARLDRTLVPSTVRRYRFSARVELPSSLRGVALDFIVPDLAASPQLFVDGEPAAPLRASSPSGYRCRGPLVWSIPAEATSDGVLELQLEVENRWTQSSWLTTIPRLVTAGSDDDSARTLTILNVLVSVCALVALFQIGLTSLGVYLVDRRRRPYLWFGIQALTATFYPLYVLGSSQVVFGTLDTPLLAIMLIVAITVSIYFTHGFFDLPPPSRTWVWAALFCGGETIVFHGPFVMTRLAAPVTVLFLIVAIGYQLYACSRLALRHPDRIGALFLLTAWVGLGAFAAPDMLAWVGLADPLGGARTGSVGLALYSLWLALLLSRRHIKSLNRADDLNVELAGRVDQLEKRRSEIEQLNVELRHQVAERSSQIFAALALAGQGRDVAPDLHAGELVQNRYRIVRPLGSGGMGAVYEVARISDGRLLALKVARELNGVALARLAREAQIACRVTHANVVAIIDVDVATAGFLYIVMELVEGQALSSLRDRFGDAAWGLPILAQIADGMAALHAADVVHRDLKPANVLLTRAGSGAPLVKISDFGISLHATTAPQPRVDLDVDDDTRPLDVPSASETVPSLPAGRRAPLSPAQLVATAGRLAAEGAPQLALTRTGQLPGTPAYIAPELVNGREHVAPPADVFAFGVIAFEVLVGKRPFAEPPTVALLENRRPERPTSLATAWQAAPRELVELVDAALSLDPRRRPTAAELVGVFRQYARAWSLGQNTA